MYLNMYLRKVQILQKYVQKLEHCSFFHQFLFILQIITCPLVWLHDKTFSLTVPIHF